MNSYTISNCYIDGKNESKIILKVEEGFSQNFYKFDFVTNLYNLLCNFVSESQSYPSYFLIEKLL